MRARRLGLRLLDAVAYAVVVSALAVAGGAAFGFATGRGWVGAKYALFVVGFLAFGYASFALRPRPPWKDEDSADRDDGWSLEAAVAEALPRELRLPADDRVGIGGKLLLASVLILLASFLMEAVFGVAAAGGIAGF